MHRERWTTAGGWLHHPKGGEAYAFNNNSYIRKTDVPVYHKKQKPPLGQVTISAYIAMQFLTVWANRMSQRSFCAYYIARVAKCQAPTRAILHGAAFLYHSCRENTIPYI